MKVRVKITHVDPYTWEVKHTNNVINIKSEAAAVKWVKQTHYKVMNVEAEALEQSDDIS